MLTGTQRDILKLKLKGRTTREITHDLSVSSKTIAKVLKIVKDYLLDKKTEIDYCNN
jgi:DNA-binding CsgD family transcriptional regulator